MRNPILILVLFVMSLYSLYLVYTAWVRPEAYKKQWQQGRNRIKNNFPFIPDVFIDGFFIGPREVALWWARIGYLIFAVTCVGLLLFVIFGSAIKLP